MMEDSMADIDDLVGPLKGSNGLWVGLRGSRVEVVSQDGTQHLFANGLSIVALTTAITANVTTTSTPSGTIGITNNATGVGSIFISDGVHWQGSLQAAPVFTTASADGAVTAKAGTVFVTKAGVAALTLADPVTVTDDGKKLLVISTTANAHTLSNAAGSGFNAGGSASDVGTFGGAIGDNIEVIAKGGKWLVITKTNVTLG